MNLQEIPWLAFIRLVMEGVGWTSVTILSALMAWTGAELTRERITGRRGVLRELDRYR